MICVIKMCDLSQNSNYRWVNFAIMEEDIAILIADLSGYTALTETHGAATAADMIEQYLAIVENSLTGDSHLHSRTGDEVVVVSSSSDNLLATSILMLQNVTGKNNFLQVHGGLHYGKILKRNDQYFGTTINFASRIASKAAAGTFWCSEDFLQSLNNKSTLSFISKGKHSFKNLLDEREVFELAAADAVAYHVDPVCRMLITDMATAIPHPEEPNVFFCSQTCFDIYMGR